jgi:uncharacterized OB-fold protein
MIAPSTPRSIEVSRCSSCAKFIVPPRTRCPHCGSPMQPVHVDGRGKILSWTTVHVTPEGIPSPRTVALVGLECGAAVLCLVEDARTLEMDMHVEVVFADGLHRLV